MNIDTFLKRVDCPEAVRVYAKAQEPLCGYVWQTAVAKNSDAAIDALIEMVERAEADPYKGQWKRKYIQASGDRDSWKKAAKDAIAERDKCRRLLREEAKLERIAEKICLDGFCCDVRHNCAYDDCGECWLEYLTKAAGGSEMSLENMPKITLVSKVDMAKRIAALEAENLRLHCCGNCTELCCDNYADDGRGCGCDGEEWAG